MSGYAETLISRTFEGCEFPPVPAVSQAGVPEVCPRWVPIGMGSLSAFRSAQGACARGFSTRRAIGPAVQAEHRSYPPPTDPGGVGGARDRNWFASGELPD
jgi:hypothetical protein